MIVAVAAVLGACDHGNEEFAVGLTGGNPRRGKAAIQAYGCMSCHTIPGVPGANALVGPSLERIGARTYIAGVLTNSPEHMETWIKDPPGVDPKTAMPKLGVTENDARDIACYLYTLR